MAILQTFSPKHLADEARKSGFFQCRKCGLAWFGREDYDFFRKATTVGPSMLLCCAGYATRPSPLTALSNIWPATRTSLE